MEIHTSRAVRVTVVQRSAPTTALLRGRAVGRTAA